MTSQLEPDYKVSRKVGYAATLKTAPAFSFGGKHERRINDPGPGPGQYGPSMDFSNPGVRFGSSTRYQNPGSGTPSPLDYKPDPSKVLRASASFSFGGKHKNEHLKSKTPGPGHYEPGPSKDSVRPGQPAITLGSKWPEDRSRDKKPAPNEYNPDYKAKENPGVSIKFRHEPTHPDMGTPGPGMYDADNAHKSPPGKSFGTSRNYAHLETPSPGPVYDQGAYETAKPQSNSWSFGKAERSPRLDNGIPGPGSYLHAPLVDRPAGFSATSEGSGLRSAPAATMTGRYFTPRPPPSPGPQDYRPTDSVRKSAPAFSMHGSSQKDSRRNYPGPGTYDSNAAFKALKPAPPSITLGQRPETLGNTDRSPAPNEYSIRWSAVDKEKPGTSIKFRHESKWADLHATPAPHDYADKDFVSIYAPETKHKGFSFGIKLKTRDRESVPGPEYQVGCSTLGVAASEKLPKGKLSQTVVL